MTDQKENWEKPELIVINRSYAEENVLANCNEGTNPTCNQQSWTGAPS